MNEEEFLDHCTRMANFQCDALGVDAGAWAMSGFLWAIWVSTAFPEWWAKWQTALPHIEGIMEAGDQTIDGMKQEINKHLINPQEEVSTWQMPSSRN